MDQLSHFVAADRFRTFFPAPIFSNSYYLVSGGFALATLGLWKMTRAREWLGSAFVPGVIILLSIGSVVLAELTNRTSLRSCKRSRSRPATNYAAATSGAYPDRVAVWLRAAFIFTAGTSLFAVGLYSWQSSPQRPLLPAATVVIIEVISFLVVGDFISSLIKRLTEQQKSLALAMQRLVQHAAVLEELTIGPRAQSDGTGIARKCVAHTQSALSMQLETVKAYIDVNSVTAKKMLDSYTIAANRTGLQETRNALKSLRASPLEDMGLVQALRRLAEQTAARTNTRLDLSLPDASLSLSAETEQAIYRIAQEALNNAADHAYASTIRVSLVTTNSHRTLTVQDDGIGFDPTKTATVGHYGLFGMQERADLAGGSLSVDSRPGQGTTIRFAIEG